MESTKPSAWQRLTDSLRALAKLRAAGVPETSFDVALKIQLAKGFWKAIPPAPVEADYVWPEDIRALAVELGFHPDQRPRPATDPALADQLVKAGALQTIAGRVAKLLEEAGIRNTEASVTPTRISLYGTASNEADRARATQIAAEQAPGLEITNHIGIG